MERDEALIGAYFYDKHRKQTKQTPWSSSQTVTPSEDHVLKNIYQASHKKKHDQVPYSVSSNSCNLKEGSRSRLPSGHSEHVEQRNNHAATREDVERMTASSLNSLKLLPDGVVELKVAHGGVRKRPTDLHEGLPKKPQRINRPKEQMTVLSAGLKETKPSSLRMIRDPEEVLRQKKKLMSGASSQSRHSSDTDIATSSSRHVHHMHEKSVSQEDQSTISKFQHVIEIGPHLRVRHARSPSPDELIDIEDVPLDSASDMDDFKLKLEETLKRQSSLRFAAIDTTEMDIIYNENEPINKRNIHEMCNENECVNIQYGDLDTCLSPVKHKESVSKGKSYEKFTHIALTDQKVKENDNTNAIDAVPREKNGKKKKSRNPFKWLYRTKSVKVENAETQAPQPRSKADLEKMATPTQGSLRKVLDSNDYVHDGKDKCFKPAVWDCDNGKQYSEEQSNVDGENINVKLIEHGIRDLDCNNNGQVVESSVLTDIITLVHLLRNGIHKRK